MELRSNAKTPQETVSSILQLLAMREASEQRLMRNSSAIRERMKHHYASELLKELMGDIQEIKFIEVTP